MYEDSDDNPLPFDLVARSFVPLFDYYDLQDYQHALGARRKRLAPTRCSRRQFSWRFQNIAFDTVRNEKKVLVVWSSIFVHHGMTSIEWDLVMTINTSRFLTHEL